MILIKKIVEIIGVIFLIFFVAFFGIGSVILTFSDKKKEDSDDSEIED